jgi:DNA-binding transcriptional LysR family regulator
MDVSLRQMEVLSEVARTGSFTQAAREMRVSQPVLSRTIRDIERTLRTRLLDRTTRSVQLTADGREFLAVAETVLQSYRAGMRRFTAYRDGEHGTFTLAALPSVAASMLPEAVAGFLARYPGIQVKIVDGTTSEVIDHLLAGRADLALTDSADAPGDLNVLPLTRDPLLAVLPPHHHLTTRPELTWHELAAEPFVAFTQGSSVRRLTDLGFASAQARPSRLIETIAVGTAAGMISAGLGVSAVPALLLPLMSFAPLQTRPLTAPALTRHLAALVPRTPPPSPPAARFLEQLAQMMPPADAGGT